MRQLVSRGFDHLADIDGRYLAAVFFSVLLTYTLALVYESFGYAWDARLFPLIVGIPLSIMILGKILLLLLNDRLDLQVVGFFEDVGDMNPSQKKKAQSRASRYRREFSMVLWIVGLVLLIYLIGNLAAVPLFIFAFILTYERNFRRAVLAAIVTSVFIYLLFIQVLDSTLWRGIYQISGAVA